MVAALVGGAFVTAFLPSVGGADTAPGTRARIEAERTAITKQEHAALLALYAAETELGAARREVTTLEARSAALAAEARSLERRAAVVRRSLAASHRRVAEILTALYVEGEADPIAAILGASSLDEVVATIESLQDAARHNRHLAREARELAEQLDTLRAQLSSRRTNASRALTAARAAERRLAEAVSERRSAVADLERRGDIAEQRLEALAAQARRAEEASRRLTVEAVQAGRDAGLARETQPAVEGEASAPAPRPSGTYSLVVDAVAYHLPGRTASGLPVGPGIVAVDPTVIPLGTRMFIPGYGPGIAADVGTAIKGNIIDLWMPSTAKALEWGRRTVTITIYG
jgi:3D (Asp-Asp-Asp) domain-containing protein/vacuolar-type H+-ATPase subunit D/Vma8